MSLPSSVASRNFRSRRKRSGKKASEKTKSRSSPNTFVHKQVGDRVLAVNGEELGGKFLAQALSPGQPAYVFTVERGGGGSTVALEATVFELLDQDELLSTSAPALATLDVSRPAAVKLAKAAANLEEAGGALDRADDEMMSFWKLVFTNDADFLKAGGASGLGSLPDCYLAAHWLCSLCGLALASD